MTRGLVDPEAVRRISRTMALRKVGQPEDVAAQVVVLASDVLSGHISGQVVTVAGGMEASPFTTYVGGTSSGAGAETRRAANRSPPLLSLL